MSEAYADIYASKPTELYLTADLQKGHHWYALREWIDGGDSGLVAWGYGVLLEDLRAVDEKHKPTAVYVDNGYPARSSELLEAAERAREDAGDPAASAQTESLSLYESMTIGPVLPVVSVQRSAWWRLSNSDRVEAKNTKRE